MFKDYGWEYIQDLNEFSYFSKLEDGTEDEIFSDNASRIDMLERIYHRKVMPLLVLFLCCIIPQGMRMTIGGNYADPISIAFYILWIVMIFLYIVLITRCIAGFNRLRKKYDIK